jgi:uncharacterized membrane protein
LLAQALAVVMLARAVGVFEALNLAFVLAGLVLAVLVLPYLIYQTPNLDILQVLNAP